MDNPNDPNQPQQQQMNIEINEDVAGGVYSNLAVINHSPSEFVVDFVQVMPGVPKARVKSRVILTPQHAKRFLRALSDNIKKFEQTHGEVGDQEQVNYPINFGGPTGQA